MRVALADHHEFEDAVDLYAADVLPADLINGDHHTVEDRIRNDTYLNGVAVYENVAAMMVAPSS